MKTHLIHFLWIVSVLTGCSLPHYDRVVEPELEWVLAAKHLGYAPLPSPLPWLSETEEAVQVNKFRLVLPNKKEILLTEVSLSRSANSWASNCAQMVEDFLQYGEDRFYRRTSILVMEEEGHLFKIGERCIPITLEFVRIFDSGKAGVNLKEEHGLLTLNVEGDRFSTAQHWRVRSSNIVEATEGIHATDEPQQYILISGISPKFVCTWVFLEDGRAVGAIINITLHPQKTKRPTIEWSPNG